MKFIYIAPMLTYIFSSSLWAMDDRFSLPPGFELSSTPQYEENPLPLPPPPTTQTTSYPSPISSSVDNSKKPEFSLTLSSDQTNYHKGEYVHISIKSNRNCYLTLIDIGSSGSITVLFPNTYQRNNLLIANQTLRIPAEDSTFDMEVSGPKGTEHILAFCRLSKQPLLQKAYHFDQYDFHTLPNTWKSELTTVADGQEARAELSFDLRD